MSNPAITFHLFTACKAEAQENERLFYMKITTPPSWKVLQLQPFPWISVFIINSHKLQCFRFHQTALQCFVSYPTINTKILKFCQNTIRYGISFIYYYNLLTCLFYFHRLWYRTENHYSYKNVQSDNSARTQLQFKPIRLI